MGGMGGMWAYGRYGWPSSPPTTTRFLSSASKYSRVILKTMGANNNQPIRFGNAIKPFVVSDRPQTKSTLALAKISNAAT